MISKILTLIGRKSTVKEERSILFERNPPACVDCIHYDEQVIELIPGVNDLSKRCLLSKHFCKTPYDPVSGEGGRVEIRYLHPNVEREQYGSCKPNGLKFERKVIE